MSIYQALCESLEDENFKLKQELLEREEKLSLFEEEMGLYKAEIENLKKALRFARHCLLEIIIKSFLFSLYVERKRNNMWTFTTLKGTALVAKACIHPERFVNAPFDI